jgi:hypothetical protein
MAGYPSESPAKQDEASAHTYVGVPVDEQLAVRVSLHQGATIRHVHHVTGLGPYGTHSHDSPHEKPSGGKEAYAKHNEGERFRCTHIESA